MPGHASDLSEGSQRLARSSTASAAQPSGDRGSLLIAVAEQPTAAPRVEDSSRPADDLPDEIVVTLAIDGNSEAFNVLVRRYHSTALRTASAIVGTDLAEDVVQDAFLLAFLALPMIRDRSKFSRWLSTITRFRALRLRRSESHRRTETIELDAARLATLSNIVCAPREELEGDDVLRSALDAIPPEYAEVLRLHFLHGMPHQKIAEFLAVPVSTVKWRCFRGKQMLRCLVYPEGSETKRAAGPSFGTAATFAPEGAGKTPGDAKKTRKSLRGGAGSTVIPVLFWSLADFLEDLVPDVLPDLVSDVLPDFLTDLLALLIV
jgi:RNA polymerase sigma-70 factor (ECF subfamily)